MSKKNEKHEKHEKNTQKSKANQPNNSLENKTNPNGTAYVNPNSASNKTEGKDCK